MHNTEVMTTIKLSGSLAKIFGREHKRLITTTQEAIRALCATLPGFEKYLNKSKFRGLTFSIFRGKQNIGEDDLAFPAGGLVNKQDADNKASYAFGGVTNTTTQGNPVPLAYGKCRIGGAIISAGIYVEDQQ